LTFEGPGFVICSFVPRLFDYHPNALKVPYNHANVDSDELLFYWEGAFMSRSGTGIEPGSISHHPAGFIHGPQPGSAEKSLTAVRTEEYAVMLDTFKPVRLSSDLAELEAPEYPWTWANGSKPANDIRTS
jgi:homogentisate 1,2-dioxygenase